MYICTYVVYIYISTLDIQVFTNVDAQFSFIHCVKVFTLAK